MTQRSNRLSVVIPVLDEALWIGAQLAQLEQIPGIAEVIVVDGGSSDGTVEIVAGHSGTKLLRSSGGRARQMNAGADEAAGDILLFLHADVALPIDAARLVDAALEEEGVVAGAFQTRTIGDRRARGIPLGPILKFADIRSRVSKLPYGDQAIFVSKSRFREVGGFPDLPIFEDLEFSRSMSRLGKISIVPHDVIVSGRRFERHPISSVLLMRTLPWLRRVGVRHEHLARIYRALR